MEGREEAEGGMEQSPPPRSKLAQSTGRGATSRRLLREDASFGSSRIASRNRVSSAALASPAAPVLLSAAAPLAAVPLAIARDADEKTNI